MNKKLIVIIGILLIIIVIVSVCIFNYKNNSTYGGCYYNNGYTIDIDSKEQGHPSNGSVFSTSFQIVDSDNNTYLYNVNYVDINLFSKTDKKHENGVIYDIARTEEIYINGKKFNYFTYTSENESSATLLYKLPDGEGELVIDVISNGGVDSTGNELNSLPVVDREILESNELAGIIDFSIKKGI